MKKDRLQKIVMPYGISEEQIQNVYKAQRFSAFRGYIPDKTIEDMEKHAKMTFGRSTFYNGFLRRRETQVSDTPYTTIERDDEDKRIVTGRYMHSSYVITERIFTEFEVAKKLKKAIICSIFGTFLACAAIFLRCWMAGYIIINK